MRDAIHAVAEEAAQSGLAQALVLAAQRLLVQALARSENIGAAEYQLPRLLEGDIGGNCAASWPHGAVAPAHARDTGRGWRMSGDFPALPALQHDWFLVSVPVLFEGAGRFSLVLLRAEEDGIVQGRAALADHPGEAGTALALKNVFLREDEIIAEDGPAAVAHLAPFAQGLQAAIFAGRCHRAVAGSPELVGAEAVIEDLLASAVQAAVHAGDATVPLAALRRMWAALSPAAHKAACASLPPALAAP